MHVKVRSGITSQELAELHEKIAAAAHAVREVVLLENDKRQRMLLKPSASAMLKINSSLIEALISLEEPLVRNEGAGAPFAQSYDPDLWHRWLKNKGENE